MQSLRASSTVAKESKASNAWVTKLELRGSPSGTLEHVTFAVKDLFSIAGHTNSCGNPTWLETHGPAASHAPCVQLLLDSGAVLAGVTQMDELAYSLDGENVHYGTPANAAAADRVSGGSSSGSAVC
jgi:amidase